MKTFLIFFLLLTNSIYSQNNKLDFDKFNKFRNELMELNQQFTDYCKIIVDSNYNAAEIKVMDDTEIYYEITLSYIDQIIVLGNVQNFELSESGWELYDKYKKEKIDSILDLFAKAKPRFINQKKSLSNPKLSENIDETIKIIDEIIAELQKSK